MAGRLAPTEQMDVLGPESRGGRAWLITRLQFTAVASLLWLKQLLPDQTSQAACWRPVREALQLPLDVSSFVEQSAPIDVRGGLDWVHESSRARAEGSRAGLEQHSPGNSNTILSR